LAPVWAVPYFNVSYYLNADPTENYYIEGVDYDGYVSSGYELDASVCVGAKSYKYFCTTVNTPFYVADSIYADHWNYGSNATSGTFGFGFNSPVWSMLGLEATTSTKNFDVYLTNFNNWYWAQPTY
jgi:hypothetical protein